MNLNMRGLVTIEKIADIIQHCIDNVISFSVEFATDQCTTMQMFLNRPEELYLYWSVHNMMYSVAVYRDGSLVCRDYMTDINAVFDIVNRTSDENDAIEKEMILYDTHD